jgi:putative membrane protein
MRDSSLAVAVHICERNVYITASMKLSRLVFAASLLFLPATLFAQATTTGATPPGGTPGAGATTEKAKPIAPADKKFVKDAGESIYYELALAEKTKVKAGTDAVKKLGEKLNQDLKKVWEEVATFAQANNEKMPTELSGGDKSAAERLGKLDGEKFDKQFLSLISKEAKKLARVFDAKSLQSPELKKVAENYGATLKNHVTEIDRAEKEASKAK